MRELAGPTIAGIPLIHEADGLVFLNPMLDREWNGGPARHPPLRIRHVERAPSRDGLVALVSAPPPQGTVCLDAAGELAIFADVVDRRGAPQLLRTVRRGHEYEIHYAHGEAADHWQGYWARTAFAYALTGRGLGVLAHAAGVRLPGGGVLLCPGASGVGKSTLAALLAEDLGPGAEVLSDDRVALVEESGVLRAYGTPWRSAAGQAAPGAGPLAAICFVRHGGPPALRPLPTEAATPKLLKALMLPFWSSSEMATLLERLDTIVRAAPAFEFSYAPRPGAGRWLADALAAERAA
ncbi:MAG TPA: hypothetical protein VNA89_03545 [Gemmatimonadaceae bacterium]|nr:hypothetical protein [Gemmatimonadaceae bacterium]